MHRPNHAPLPTHWLRLTYGSYAASSSAPVVVIDVPVTTAAPSIDAEMTEADIMSQAANVAKREIKPCRGYEKVLLATLSSCWY